MNDYYSSCPIPKPSKKKKKLLCNGYKNKAERFCYYCHTPYAERHEVYAGSERQVSIRESFQVDLCHSCHEEIQHLTTKRGVERDMYWKKHYEKIYIEKLLDGGVSKQKAVEIWIALIGRNYLEEGEI